MVLHHIAHRSHRVVKAAPIQHIELLRHGDLHAFHVEVVPDRLQKGVGEAKEDHVLYRVLAQVVIDAKDVFFTKYLMNSLLSAKADAKSLPKGFSITTRAPWDDPDAFNCFEDLAEEERAEWQDSEWDVLRCPVLCGRLAKVCASL